MFSHTDGAYRYELENKEYGNRHPLIVGTQRLTGFFRVISRKLSCPPTCPRHAVRPAVRSARCTCTPPEVLFYLESRARMPHSERPWQHGANCDGGAVCITDASRVTRVCQVLQQMLEGVPHIRVCSLAGEVLLEMPAPGFAYGDCQRCPCSGLHTLREHVAKECLLNATEIWLVNADGLHIADDLDAFECLPC